jgi:hypothetical protein
MSLAQSAKAGPSASAVAAIWAAEILGLSGFSIIPALLPQFTEPWSLTNTEAGWLAGIKSAGYMLAVIPLVSLTDRWPGRQLYLAFERPECAVLLRHGAMRRLSTQRPNLNPTERRTPTLRKPRLLCRPIEVQFALSPITATICHKPLASQFASSADGSCRVSRP